MKRREKGGEVNEKKGEKGEGRGKWKERRRGGREYAESHTIIRMFSSNGLEHVFYSC